MNTDTGTIYTTEAELEAARARNEPLTRLTEHQVDDLAPLTKEERRRRWRERWSGK